MTITADYITTLTQALPQDFPIDGEFSQQPFLPGLTPSREEFCAGMLDPVLHKRENFARHYARMKDYMQEVGFAHFAAEQERVDKILWALNVIHDEWGAEFDNPITALQEHFTESPPFSAQEMLQHIANYTELLGAADAAMQANMRQLLERLHQLHAIPHSHLETLGRRSSSRL